jgi:radical SAM superfamily enzyme YgiQ (UPF0313 family)
MTGIEPDCLLVHVPKEQTYYPPLNIYRSCNQMSLGLMALADLADRSGYQTRVVHIGVEKALDGNFSFSRYLRRCRPRAIGFSLQFHHGLIDTLALVEEARRALPEAFLFLGGFTATFFGRDIMETALSVDGVVKGDSEAPLLALLEELGHGGDRQLGKVPNLLWRREGLVVENDQTYVTTEQVLNDLRYTRFELLDHFETYFRLPKAFMVTNLPSRLNMKFNSLLGRGKKSMFLGLPVGRGCVFNCYYCGGGSRAQRNINRRRGVIFRKPEKVVETIEALRRYGFRSCYLSFDPRPWSEPYYLELFRLLQRRKVDFGFHFSAWKLVSREFLDEFARLPQEGSAYLISPESGSEQVRKTARGYSYRNAELLENLEYADSLGIRTVVYFSLGGLERTRKDLDDTLRLKAEIHRRVRHATVEAFLVEAEPGSPWHLDPEKYQVSLRRRSLADFITDQSSPSYSSMTSLGYTTGLFGDPDIPPREFEHHPGSRMRADAGMNVLASRLI